MGAIFGGDLSPAPVPVPAPSVGGFGLGSLSLSSLSPAMADVVVKLQVAQTCALERCEMCRRTSSLTFQSSDVVSAQFIAKSVLHSYKEGNYAHASEY